MGDSIVLGTASSPDDTLDIELEKVASIEFGDFENRFPAWKTEQERVLTEITLGDNQVKKKGDWDKACPVFLRPPLSDFPVAKITYSPIRYSRARSFFTVLEKNPELWRELAVAGTDYRETMPKRPGILVAHMVVLARGDDDKPCVVLCQRSTRQKDHMGFELGKWSASIEEQFRITDQTLSGTITRGLKEELLGPYAETTKNIIAAIFLERRILNLVKTTMNNPKSWACHLITTLLRTASLPDSYRRQRNGIVRLSIQEFGT
jgi:hypothetical protein